MNLVRNQAFIIAAVFRLLFFTFFRTSSDHNLNILVNLFQMAFPVLLQLSICLKTVLCLAVQQETQVGGGTGGGVGMGGVVLYVQRQGEALAGVLGMGVVNWSEGWPG